MTTSEAIRRAIINQGAFFSPYYLFDVLGRQHVEELDPLGREANRRLLRQNYRKASAHFGETGSKPGEAWHAWYEELFTALGFDSTRLRRMDAPVDAGRFGLVPISHVAAPSTDTPPIVFIDLHGFGVDLDSQRYPQAGKAVGQSHVTIEPVARAIEFALDHNEARWAIVAAGERLRLYRKGGSVARQYLEVAFTPLFDGDRTDEWTAFWGLFRYDAFVPDPTSGACLLDRVLEESQRHAARIADDLRENIVLAVEALIQGVLDEPANKGLFDHASPQALQQIFEESLYFLYRLLFVLYAESRDLLPLGASPVYRDTYSLEHLRAMAEQPLHPDDHDKTYYSESLRTLFTLLRAGFPAPGRPLAASPFRIPSFNGQLFDVSRTALLDRCRIGDRAMREVIRELSLSRPRRRNDRRERYSYADLGVDQLGSIYEGLLVFEPMITDEEMVVAKVKGEERLLTRAQAEDQGLAIIEGSVRTPGSFVLRVWGGRRKGSGSYYTPQEITAFLVKEALEPLVEPIVQGCAERDVHGQPCRLPSEILELKVCDPAMGSAAFLVQACRYLAEAYGRARIAAGLDDDGRISQEELASYKRRVAEKCLYGVDLNPMAVELAKVSLWLETLSGDRPLTFLDAHLRCGNALIGAPLRDAAGVLSIQGILSIPDAALEEVSKEATKAQKAVARERIKRNREQIKNLQRQRGGQMNLPDEDAFDIHAFERTLADTLERRRELEISDEGKSAADAVQLIHAKQRMFDSLEHGPASRYRRAKLVLDLWCAVWFWPEPDFEIADLRLPILDLPPSVSSNLQSKIENLQSPPTTSQYLDLVARILDADAAQLDALEREPLLATAMRVAAERRFFHWELELPEIFDGGRGGFDALVANPPWDKVKPNEREFYANYDPTIWDFQGAARKRFISSLRRSPEVVHAWSIYERKLIAEANYLFESGVYQHQTVVIDGKTTGGDPDVFKYFTERAFHLVHLDGRVGIVAPFGIQMSQGSTGLRKMLLDQCRLEVLCKLDNERLIFPGVFHGQKFDLLVFSKGGPSQTIEAAFLSWEDAEVITRMRSHPRYLRIEAKMLRALDPEQYTFIELRNQREASLAKRLYDMFPRFGQEVLNNWNASFTRELDMTNDSYLFVDHNRLEQFGAAQHSPYWQTPAPEWYTRQIGIYEYAERVVDASGKVYLANNLDLKKVRYHYQGFLLCEEIHDTNALPILPDTTYAPLYEGRLVHQFDHAAKAYVRGSGRGSEWDELRFPEKSIVPHYYVPQTEFASTKYRAGFCSVTGQTNERSLLAAMIPNGMPCGNSVPTMATEPDDIRHHLVWVTVTNSVVIDWLLRLRVSNNINFFLIEALAIARLRPEHPQFTAFLHRSLALTCTTPEFAELWDEVAASYPEAMPTPWRTGHAATDPAARAQLRAEIDALVADLYGLSEEDFAYILSTFPLLDRDQPALAGDVDEKGAPRSYITRDTALLELFKLRGKAPPADIVAFFATAGADITRLTGPLRGLGERVAAALALGAVGYVPGGRGRDVGEGDSEEEGEP